MKYIQFFLILSMLQMAVFLNIHAEEVVSKNKIGVDEKTGQTLNLNLVFNDEDGKKITLKELVDVPVILVPVYLTCPHVCNMQLSALASAISEVKLRPLKDYKIITISFDENDTYQLAKEKKINYLSAIGKDFPAESWKFLTGDKNTIKTFTDSIGYHYLRVGKDFQHPVSLVFITKEGKIVRYLYGTNILPFDITLALNEASTGQVGTSIKRQVLNFCFAYDTNENKYSFNILKISASIIILFVIIIFLVLLLGGKKRWKK